MELVQAAAQGDAGEVARLLDAGADPNATIEQGLTALHIAALHGHSHVISALLAAGGSPTLSGPDGLLPIHAAADVGHPAAARLLLEAAPHTAAAVGMNGHTPLFLAAQGGHAETVHLLLEAAPEAALVRTVWGLFPLYTACSQGHTAVVRQLLAAAPQAAAMLAGDENSQATPLHGAVKQGHLEIVQLISEAQPQAARVVSSQGSLALHLAALSDHPCSAAMVRLLLAAAPDTAAAPIRRPGAPLPSNTPLHLAATSANVAAARLLVQAAPSACLTLGSQRLMPLEVALTLAAAAQRVQAAAAPDGPPSRIKPLAAYLDTARVMLAAMAPDFSLLLLARYGDVALPLFPTVAAHWPLTAAQWQQVPSPCPGLGSALPAALQRAEAEAAPLVAHLPAADAARLRAFALALRRSQRQLGIFLPGELVGRILSLFDA